VRRSCLASIVAALGILFAVGPAFAATVTIDGAPVSGSVVRQGHILVPFRAPMQQLGATVVWSNSDQSGVASISGHELVRTTIGSAVAVINGNQKTLTVAPVLIEHLEYVPVEMLPEISHAKLALSPDGNTATITEFDLAGVNDVGSSAAAPAPSVKTSYGWIWLLPLAAVIYAIAYFVIKRRLATGQS
jgi:hypothetical protein